MIDTTKISEAVPADVDENCETLDNCPRYYTGQYAALKDYNPEVSVEEASGCE